MKKLWTIAIVVLAVFFVTTACKGGSNANSEPTRPPVSNLRYQDFHAEATQCYTRLTGCEPGEVNRIYLSHVGERVRWTNSVSFNKGNTLVLYNGQGPIALLNIPSETINNLKVGDELIVEGTIVAHSEYGWALDDVAIDESLIPTPKPLPTARPVSDYDVTIELDEQKIRENKYWATFDVTNNSSSKIEVYFVSTGYFASKNGQPTGVGVYATHPWAGGYTISLNPNETKTTSWVYGRVIDNAGDFVQFCGTLYNIVPYGQKGDEIIAEWKMSEELPCIGQ